MVGGRPLLACDLSRDVHRAAQVLPLRDDPVATAGNPAPPRGAHTVEPEVSRVDRGAAVYCGAMMEFSPCPKPPKRVRAPKLKKVARVPKAFSKHRAPAYHAWIGTFACLLAGRAPCQGRVEAHHIFGRKADDVGTELPLCELHHMQWHTWGRLTWQKRYEVDAQAAAALLGRKYLKEVAPCP